MTIYPNTGYVCIVFDEEFSGGVSIEKACVKRCAAVVRWDVLLPVSTVGVAADAVVGGPGKVVAKSAKELEIGFTPLTTTVPAANAGPTTAKAMTSAASAAVGAPQPAAGECNSFVWQCCSLSSCQPATLSTLQHLLLWIQQL